MNIPTPTTKEKISRAAIELIAARGIDAVSMRDIARLVGVTEAALYRHFPNKNELIWEVFTSNYDSFAEHLEYKQSEFPELRQKLASMVQSCCELFDRDCDLFVFLLVAQHIQRFAPKDYSASLPVLLHTLLLDAASQGEIPPQDVEHSAAMIMGCVIQSALYCLYHRPEPLKMTPKSAALSLSCWHIVKGLSDV